MPKATSRTFKKKKYNARFPPARIKKIMQTDEEVGKVAAAVPVIISRALEMFIESLILKTAKTTQGKNAKTLSTSHMSLLVFVIDGYLALCHSVGNAEKNSQSKQTIHGEKQFDFLRDLVKNVPDHQVEDNGDAPMHETEPVVKRGRGRPRKSSDATKPGRKNKSGHGRGASDSSEEEEEYDMEDDEDTETDEEGPQITSAPAISPDRLPLVQSAISSTSNGAGVYQPGFSGAMAMPVPPSQDRSSLLPPFSPYVTPSQVPMPPSLPLTITHPPAHLIPNFTVTAPQQLPVNLSNRSFLLPAVGTTEDDDYDS